MPDIVPIKHQSQFANFPWKYPEINTGFLVAGFGAGKSFSVCYLILKVVQRYWDKPVTIGIGSSTITLLKKTIIADLEKLMIESGSKYSFNRQENFLQIGKVKFVLIAQDQPQLIYGYNFSAFFSDELDELEQTKAIDAFKAIKERTRVTFPDGRPPFVTITTTAQGYRGVYQILETLKEKNQPYILIRASTKDNIYNSPEFYQNLYNLYNENERRAYLEGYFVNLTAGRVYPEYDEEKHMVEDFPLEPMETIHIGQDLNRGFSKATAWVVRDKKLYCVNEFSFEAIGRAPQILRNAFPTNPILWYPDASSKEIMQGYNSEIAAQGIQMRWASVNPSIVDRTMVINKLFASGRAFLTKSCKKLSMALKTRQFNELGEPEKGKGENAPDHLCFVAGTMIATNKGDIPIEDIKKGDMILTRKGYKKCLDSFFSGFEKTIFIHVPGHTIQCTLDHPIWSNTKNKFIPAKKIKGHKLFCIAKYKMEIDFNPKAKIGYKEKQHLPVFNLTVEDAHEYFANGILVSNCDSGEYVTWRIVSSNMDFFDLYSITRTYQTSKER